MGQRNITAVGLHATLRGLPRAGALLLIAVCGCLTAAAQTTNFIELLNLNAAGTQVGNGSSAVGLSSGARSSDDGRFVVFESNASDLVPGDTNESTDIFVRDLQLDTTRLVSVNAAGTGSGNSSSFFPSITPDGRFVVFQSSATDLTAINGNPVSTCIYVRDLVAQTTTLASLDSSNVALHGSFAPSITPDGRFVVFNHNFDVYRRDLLTATTVLVSVNTGGTGGVSNPSGARITPDGRFVVFATHRHLVPIPSDGVLIHIYRRDLQTNTTALVSVNSAGTGSGNADSLDFATSDDGRVVAFRSAATNLVPAEPGTSFTSTSIYVRDFAANTTTLVSERQVFEGAAATVPPAELPRVSADGRYVFYLRTENFVGGLNRAGFRDRIFRRDLQTGALLELPFVAAGLCDQGFNCRSIITTYVTSRDGRYVAYRQQEHPRSDFVTNSPVIVVRDMIGGGTEVITGFPGVAFPTFDQTILVPRSVVAGGKVAFSSGVSHSPADTNENEDAYFFSPPAQTRLAFNRAGYDVGEGGSLLITHIIKVRRAGYLIDTPSTVKLTTSGGTATAGTDYLPLSETLTFAAGETEKTVTVQIVNDDVVEPVETVGLTLSDPTGNSMLGVQGGATLTIGDDDLHTVQFSPPTLFDEFVSELNGSVLITVTRTGATSHAVSVDYATADGTASERSDYITASGRLTFAPGETTKSFRVFIVNDAFPEPDETFSVTLANLRGTNAAPGALTTKQVTIGSEDATPAGPNPADNSQFFVRQHYLDFLNREPDTDGLQFWTNEIAGCGANVPCREVKRVNVSAAFFLSIEFQETGYLAYKAHKAAFGNLPGKPVPITRAEMTFDAGQIGEGVAVGVGDWFAKLEQNKAAYFNALVAAERFAALYPASMTPEAFVDALNANAGGALSPAERQSLIDELAGGTKTRAQALRAVAEDSDLHRAETNRAFVLMQYFGYLRRDPDAAGFDGRPDPTFEGYFFWLDKLNDFNGNFVNAEMVRAFIESIEYRQRFGQ
jgi:Tol biopolymer transport system component